MPDLYVTGFVDQFMDADKPIEALGTIGTITGIAGEAISIENSIYMRPSDGKFMKTDASAGASSKEFLALATSAAASGAVVTGQFFGVYYSTGYISTGTYYLSIVAGILGENAPTGTGEIVRPFGYGLSPSGLFIRPDDTYIEIGGGTSLPTHASSHTNGTDDIQLATASQKGLMSTTYAGQLDNMPTGYVTEFNGETGVITGVNSVNGYGGIVSLNTDDIPEGTNKYTTAAEISKLAGISTGAAVLSVNTATGHVVLDADAVLSVNTMTGHVVLDADDISDAATTNKYTTAAEISKLAGISTGAAVLSVNTVTGHVVLDADDISDAATTNKYTTAAEISKLTGISTGAAVLSVNTVTGHVSLDADDINATATNQYITPDELAKLSGISTGAAVLSVNTETGHVVLTTDDISDSAQTSKFAVTGQLTKVDEHHNGVNTQTSTPYTLVRTDAGKFVEMNVAGANTVTIPTNASVAFPLDTSLDVIQYGAGLTTVSGAAGVTVNGVTPGGGATAGQYFAISLYKRGTNEWIAIGSQGTV